MSDTIRAKFVCDSVAKKRGDREEAQLLAVTDSLGEENDFADATPFGQLEITIDAEGAQGWFEPGQKYYLDFTPAD